MALYVFHSCHVTTNPFHRLRPVTEYLKQRKCAISIQKSCQRYRFPRQNLDRSSNTNSSTALIRDVIIHKAKLEEDGKGIFEDVW